MKMDVARAQEMGLTFYQHSVVQLFTSETAQQNA